MYASFSMERRLGWEPFPPLPSHHTVGRWASKALGRPGRDPAVSAAALAKLAEHFVAAQAESEGRGKRLEVAEAEILARSDQLDEARRHHQEAEAARRALEAIVASLHEAQNAARAQWEAERATIRAEAARAASRPAAADDSQQTANSLRAQLQAMASSRDEAERAAEKAAEKAAAEAAAEKGAMELNFRRSLAAAVETAAAQAAEIEAATKAAEAAQMAAETAETAERAAEEASAAAEANLLKCRNTALKAERQQEQHAASLAAALREAAASCAEQSRATQLPSPPPMPCVDQRSAGPVDVDLIEGFPWVGAGRGSVSAAVQGTGYMSIFPWVGAGRGLIPAAVVAAPSSLLVLLVLLVCRPLIRR